MEESAAIARLKAGDIGGLEPLVRTYQVRAVRAAFLICHDPALAEDIVQAAFVRAYERIAQFDAARAFGPWFLQSVINDALKAATRQGRTVPLDWDETDAEAGALPDPGPTPEERLDAAETSAAIATALARLSPEQRAAIVLRYYLGLSESEMTARLRAPPGTVKWRLHAARQRLRTLLPAWVHPSLDRDP
jgi:RNA polymerase sigma-70 factor (ECF subfamily)